MRDLDPFWFCVPQAAWLDVKLVNSSHARQLVGRTKTDRLEAQWLVRPCGRGCDEPQDHGALQAGRRYDLVGVAFLIRSEARGCVARGLSAGR